MEVQENMELWQLMRVNEKTIANSGYKKWRILL